MIRSEIFPFLLPLWMGDNWVCAPVCECWCWRSCKSNNKGKAGSQLENSLTAMKILISCSNNWQTVKIKIEVLLQLLFIIIRFFTRLNSKGHFSLIFLPVTWILPSRSHSSDFEVKIKVREILAAKTLHLRRKKQDNKGGKMYPATTESVLILLF